jgi:23S rRNA U2552 (ribose-2'-O)-methylase RlmE/FtsJ
MKSIQDLFMESSGKVIYKWHHYLPIYESLFNKFVGTQVNVLEIGVLRGGSLKLWKEYFGANAKIYGIDIDPAAKQYEAEGIKIFIGDQGDKRFLAGVLAEVGGFDIVIDDGAHTNFMIMSSLEALYPATRHLYIVEDTHALYWWGGGYSLLRDIQCAISGKDNMNGVLKHLTAILMRIISGKLSFMKFVKNKQDSLTTDWHGFRKKDDQASLLSSERTGTGAVSSFTSMTNGIRVYDSMVVFEKGMQLPRRAEIR